MTPASYLPSNVTDVFSQGRAFAIAKLPHAGKEMNQFTFYCLRIYKRFPSIDTSKPFKMWIKCLEGWERKTRLLVDLRFWSKGKERKCTSANDF